MASGLSSFLRAQRRPPRTLGLQPPHTLRNTHPSPAHSPRPPSLRILPWSKRSAQSRTPSRALGTSSRGPHAHPGPAAADALPSAERRWSGAGAAQAGPAWQETPRSRQRPPEPQQPRGAFPEPRAPPGVVGEQGPALAPAPPGQPAPIGLERGRGGKGAGLRPGGGSGATAGDLRVRARSLAEGGGLG